MNEYISEVAIILSIFLPDLHVHVRALYIGKDSFDKGGGRFHLSYISPQVKDLLFGCRNKIVRHKESRYAQQHRKDKRTSHSPQKRNARGLYGRKFVMLR